VGTFDIADDSDTFNWTKSSALTSGAPETSWSSNAEIESALAIEPGAPEELTDGFRLESAYPNPFNPSTAVRFSVAQSQHVTITLYDALGRQVADLYDGYAEANHFETVRVDGSFLPSGTYTVRLEGETILGTTRIVLIK